MVEPTDALMPMLQRIQADVADVKRTQAKHGQWLEAQGEKLNGIEG